MKRILFFLLSLITGISIVACGATPTTPTLSVEQIEGTAIEAAYTAMAQTQASLPTDTAIPPSETPTQTPLPTQTLLPTATETLGTPSTIPSTPTLAVSADECNKPLSSFSGPEAYILIANKTGQPIQVWFLVNKTPFGDCGYVTVPPIPAGGDYGFNAPLACYSAGAWTTGDKKFTIDNVRYPLCANNTDKWVLNVTKTEISLSPP